MKNKIITNAVIPNIDAITMATIVPVDIESVGRPSPMIPVSVFTSPTVRDCGVPDVRVTCRVDGMTEPLVSVLGREEVKLKLSKPIKGNYYFFFPFIEFELCHSDLWGEDCMFCFEFELCHNDL
jgi:hypothetical protein